MSTQNLYPENMKVKRAFKEGKFFYPGFDEGAACQMAAEFKLDTGKKIKNLSTGYQSLFKLIMAIASNAPYLFWMNRYWDWMPTIGKAYTKSCWRNTHRPDAR